MLKRRTLLTAAAATGVAAAAGPLVASPAVAAHGGGRGKDILIQGGRVLTMDPEIGELNPGDVLVRNGKISKIAEHIEVRRNMEVIPAAGMVVIPGYVNAHQHLWNTMFRGHSANHSFQDYFQRVLRTLGPKLTPEHIYQATLVGALGEIYNGTTTVLDWSHALHTREHAQAAAQALMDSGIRGFLGYASPITATGVGDGPTEADLEAVERQLRRSKLVDLHMATRNPESNPADMPRIIADIEQARAMGITISTHAGFGGGPSAVELLGDLLGPDIIFVHGNQFDELDFDGIAANGSWVISTPEVEQQMGFGPTPLRPMLEAGVRPVVASDIVSVTRSDIPTQLKILVQSQRAADFAAGADWFGLEDVVPYGNVNPAAALGMSSRIGTLTPGKQADIVLLNSRLDLNLTVTMNMMASLVLHAHPGHVHTVLVGGKIVKQGAVIPGHDLPALCQTLLVMQQQILAEVDG